MNSERLERKIKYLAIFSLVRIIMFIGQDYYSPRIKSCEYFYDCIIAKIRSLHKQCHTVVVMNTSKNLNFTIDIKANDLVIIVIP